MDIQRLVKADLNLLVTLFLLMEERSVTRAAERLFITQSAVSKALSRLRELFDDPLFTRVGHELVPTPFLEAKKPQLCVILKDISTLVTPIEFDPHHYEAEIKVTFPELIDLVVIPRLLAYLHEVAPGIKIKSEPYGSDVLEPLALGAAEFAISPEYRDYPENYHIDLFVNATPAGVARRQHPFAGKAIPLHKLAEYPRIMVKMPDRSLTEFYNTFITGLEEAKSWPIVYETESMLSALSIIRHTDYLMPVPDFVADSLVKSTEVSAFSIAEFPQNLFKYVIVSHDRIADSALHQWFRGVLIDIGQEIMAENAHSSPAQ